MSTPTDPSTTFRSTAKQAGVLLKASAGRLFSLRIYNKKNATQFYQVHDSATVPADGAIPAFVVAVATLTDRQIDFGHRGDGFLNGIYVCNSTTDETKTLGAADSLFTATFA